MRRVRIRFALLAVALLVPLALLVGRVLRSLDLERRMRHQVVAERVFDEMERALSEVLDGEEGRSSEKWLDVDAPALPFVVDRFQIDPDGSVRTAGGSGDALTRIVGPFFRQAAVAQDKAEAEPAQRAGSTVTVEELEGKVSAPAVADEVAKRAPSAYDALRSLNKGAEQRVARQKMAAAASEDDGLRDDRFAAPAGARSERAPAMRENQPARVDTAPMVGRAPDDRHLLLYRTVVRDARAYRQGLLLDVAPLGAWLRERALGKDGLDATLAFWTPAATTTPAMDGSAFAYRHRFADPFDDLRALLTLRPLPAAAGTTYVYGLIAVMLLTTGVGLAALYRMVAVVVAYAERRSNFVAAVSHELKTPLTAIRMYGEMLRDGIVPSEQKRAEYYGHITAESERLSRLINNVLEFSRLERNARTPALVTGSIGPLVREAGELLRPHAEREGFRLEVTVDEPLPPVRYERDALLQVLFNLVDNAVKYSTNGSPRRIALSCRAAGDAVRVIVRDHGPGVPERHMRRIFEPFYRGEDELTRRSKGTGLGLALVRGLAEQMCAVVSARNVSGGGFEVEVVLPYA
jgi:signal transduction histidine kinase